MIIYKSFFKAPTITFIILLPFLCSASFLSKDFETLFQTKVCPQGQLMGADLSRIKDIQDLRGAFLVGANIQDPNLTKDILYGADIRQASLPYSLEGLDIWNIPGRAYTVKDGDETIDMSKRLTKEGYSRLLDDERQNWAFSHFVQAFFLEICGTSQEDKTQARHLYEKSAEKNYWPALNNLGWIYEWGYGVKKNIELAYDFYEKAAPHDLVASFNLTRFQAVYRQDREAFYSLGAKYKSGKGAPEDMDLAFHWIQKAADQAHTKACRYAGMMCKSGTGISKDLEQAFTYLKKGADPHENFSGTDGDPESQYELGRLYETGQGVPQDFMKARLWYKKASNADLTGALMHLGKLYEEGKGGDVSFKKAMNCYQKVAAQGRIVGMYNQGRMLEYTPNEFAWQKAVQLYKKILEQDSNHIGTLFLLGIHLEKGRGIKKDKLEANKLYQKAADGGHALAKIRIFILNNLGKVDDEEMREHRDLFENLRERVQSAQERVAGELARNYRISEFNLTEDYCKCFNLLETLSGDSHGGPRMNLKALPFDPYVGYITFSDPVTPEESTPDAVENIFTMIREAGQENSALTDDLLEELLRVSKTLSTPMSQQLRERFMRLYKAWTSEERGFLVPDDIIERLKYRQGLVAQKLVQNIGRCADGLSEFFSEEELSFALPEGQDIPMGLRLSFILLQYKQSFLERHLIPHPENDQEIESNTEARVLAFQRLRLPLGLPGVFTEPLYPHMGQGNIERYRPEVMVRRLIEGGRIDVGELIQPLTVQNVCHYFQEVINDPNSKLLNKKHINDFVLKDSVLKQAGKKAFIEFEENDYFDPFVRDNASPYKIKTFERILALHGYIIYPENFERKDNA